MELRHSEIQNACYYYLAKDESANAISTGKYHLFLLFPIAEGQTVVCKRGIASRSSLNITVTWADQKCALEKGARNYIGKQFELTFSEKQKEIVIHNYMPVAGKPGAIRYSQVAIDKENADKREVTATEIQDGLAYQSPYAHLIRARVVYGGNPYEFRFYPKVLVLMSGFEFDPLNTSTDKEGLIVTKEFGARLALKYSNDSKTRVIDASNVYLNHRRYRDKGKVDGKLKVSVKLPGGQSPYQVVIKGLSSGEINTGARSKTADSTPTVGIFIDGY